MPLLFRNPDGNREAEPKKQGKAKSTSCAGPHPGAGIAASNRGGDNDVLDWRIEVKLAACLFPTARDFPNTQSPLT